MKKLVASVGMLALGVSGLQMASAQGITAPDTAKPWSISATLRGFYDDNRDTLPDGFNIPGYDKDSLGFEVSPRANFKWDMEQTSINLGYTYSYKYFDKKSFFENDHDRQSHEFNLALDHAFSERYRISAADSFVIGQEPDQLRSGNTMESYTTVPGDNIRNEGRVAFGADITPVFGVEVGYANSYTDYEDDSNAAGEPSLSGLLDRMTQVINLDGRITLTPSTVGVVGYAFSDTDYLRDEVLGFRFNPNDFTFDTIMSDARNNRSHYFYVGADHMFSPDFSGSIRAGGRYNDYYNDDNSDSDISPYVRASIRYAYLSTGSIEAGLGYDRTATDMFGVQGGDFVRDQDAGTIFATVRQQIVPRLTGSLTGQFQNSTMNGGNVDGDSEQYYLVGLNLQYEFTRHFSAEVGYNYDLLNSDIPGRDFDRNRVYVGVTATY